MLKPLNNSVFISEAVFVLTQFISFSFIIHVRNQNAIIKPKILNLPTPLVW